MPRRTVAMTIAATSRSDSDEPIVSVQTLRRIECRQDFVAERGFHDVTGDCCKSYLSEMHGIAYFMSKVHAPGPATGRNYTKSAVPVLFEPRSAAVFLT